MPRNRKTSDKSQDPINQGFPLLTENPQWALKYFEGCLTSYNDGQLTLTEDQLQRCWYGYARACFELRYYDIAIQTLNSLIMTEPSFISPYITLARIYEVQGQLEGARELYEKALSISPTHAELLGHYRYLVNVLLPSTYTPGFSSSRAPAPQVSRATDPALVNDEQTRPKSAIVCSA